MSHGGFGRRAMRSAVALLALTASSALVNVGLATSAGAASACHWNTNGDSTYGYGQVGTYYPVTLHGKTVRLYTDKVNASVFTAMDNAVVGDVLSIDRSNFAVSGTAAHYWHNTSWIMAQTPNSGYDYCQWTATKAGYFTTFKYGSAGVIDGAHRYIRVCLRHSGSLQCSDMWYGDNDDNWNSIIP